MAIAAGANPSAGTEPGLQANWHFLCADEKIDFETRQSSPSPSAMAGASRHSTRRWGNFAAGASRFEPLKKQVEALRAQIETVTAEIASLATSFTTGNHERRTGISLLRHFNAKVFADLPREDIRNFRVPGNSRTSSQRWVLPPRMIASFPDELATVPRQVCEQVPPFHTASVTS
jgi:hypothetical protein